MNKKFKIACVLLILIFSIVILGLQFWLHKGIIITIHEKELIEKVNAMFPIEKTHFYILKIKYSNPIVELLDNENRVRIGLTASPPISVNENSFQGSAIVTGGFRFVPEKGEFYLTDFRVESLKLGNTKGIHLEKITNALSSALEDVYSVYPIYRLKENSLKEATAKMLVKKIEIQNKTVYIQLGY